MGYLTLRDSQLQRLEDVKSMLEGIQRFLAENI